MNTTQSEMASAALPLAAAADLQDHLLTATHDLDRLQTLLADACDTLMARFLGASEQVRGLMDNSAPASDSASAAPPVYDELMQQLGGAVVALQFQDMASQLIAHANRRLRNCADRLASDTFDNEDGDTVIEAPPLRPNPVTQDEMDAGSVDLF
jgi:hypothetical protein